MEDRTSKYYIAGLEDRYLYLVRKQLPRKSYGSASSRSSCPKNKRVDLDELVGPMSPRAKGRRIHGCGADRERISRC